MSEFILETGSVLKYRSKNTNKIYKAIQYTGNNAEEVLSFIKSRYNNKIKITIKDKDYFKLVLEFTNLDTNCKSTVTIDKHSFIIFIKDTNTMMYNEQDFWDKFTYNPNDNETENKKKTYPGKYKCKDNEFLYDVIKFTGDNVDDIKEFYENRGYVITEASVKTDPISNITYLKIKSYKNYKNLDHSDIIEVDTYVVFSIRDKQFLFYNETTFNEYFKKVEMVVQCNINEEQSTLNIEDKNINNKINILGTEYTLFRCKEGENGVDSLILGLCDRNLKEIKIVDSSTIDRYKDSASKWRYINESYTLRHEIVHAYLTESGLNTCSHYTTCWPEDEEIVDWIACQTEKMVKSFKEADKWLKQFFIKKEE